MSTTRRGFLKQATAIGATIGGGMYAVGWGRAAGKSRPHPLRPPGALAEEDFLATCIRCLRCVDACPNHALFSIPTGHGGAAGTPTLQPRQAPCMLCSGVDGDDLKCTQACPSGALQRVRKERDDIRDKVHMGVARIDTNLCYSYNNWSCGACYHACPLAGEAMTIGMWERPTVNPQSCVGCGCCERACIRYPQAIRVETDRAS